MRIAGGLEMLECPNASPHPTLEATIPLETKVAVLRAIDMPITSRGLGNSGISCILGRDHTAINWMCLSP